MLMASKTAARRQEKMTAVKSAHNDRVGKLRKDVHTCFERHEQQLYVTMILSLVPLH